MSNIDTIKGLLNNTLSDGKSKLSCIVNKDDQSSKNVIMLFYTGSDNPPLALSQNTALGYYSIEVECATRHKDYTKSRDMAFKCIEHLGANRQQVGLSLFFHDISPNYRGKDERNGAHIWAFKFLMRGNK